MQLKTTIKNLQAVQVSEVNSTPNPTTGQPERKVIHKDAVRVTCDGGDAVGTCIIDLSPEQAKGLSVLSEVTLSIG